MRNVILGSFVGFIAAAAFLAACGGSSTVTPQANLDELTQRVTSLEGMVASLQDLLKHVSRQDDDLMITGANLHVRNGTGTTDGAVNGLGNLVVGYNEDRTDDGLPYTEDMNLRTGSHMLVVGSGLNYSTFGGVVAGLRNAVAGEYASVTGGWNNSASGQYASVSGGCSSTASGSRASVSGGCTNIASGTHASVSGGAENQALEDNSSVSGGQENGAVGVSSSVSGGHQNKANGPASSITGGFQNTADGKGASVSGGTLNDAPHDNATCSGGNNQDTTGTDDHRP